MIKRDKLGRFLKGSDSPYRMFGNKNPFFGKHHTKETKRKLSENNAKFWLGKKLSEEHKRKMSENSAKYWLGKKLSEETKKKIGVAKKGKKNYNWKGDKVGYRALHDWVRKHKGKPAKCEHFGKDKLTGKKIHWANKNGKYLRDLSDWLRLCMSCHKKYDKELNQRII